MYDNIGVRYSLIIFPLLSVSINSKEIVNKFHITLLSQLLGFVCPLSSRIFFGKFFENNLEKFDFGLSGTPLEVLFNVRHFFIGMSAGQTSSWQAGFPEEIKIVVGNFVLMWIVMCVLPEKSPLNGITDKC